MDTAKAVTDMCDGKILQKMKGAHIKQVVAVCGRILAVLEEVDRNHPFVV